MKASFSLKLLKNLPLLKKQLTISTLITLLRLFLLPFIIGAMILNHWYFAFVVFLIAGFTDVVDGWLARYLNQQTFLGAALDTITDKIMLVGVFFTLLFIQPFRFQIPIWFVLLILTKELIQIGGSLYIYYQRGYLNIKPTILGKMSGVLQTAFITWLFSSYFFHWTCIKATYAMLASTTSMVVVTFFDYLRIGYSSIRS